MANCTLKFRNQRSKDLNSNFTNFAKFQLARQLGFNEIQFRFMVARLKFAFVEINVWSFVAFATVLGSAGLQQTFICSQIAETKSLAN